MTSSSFRSLNFLDRLKIPENRYDGHGDCETDEIQRKPDFSEVKEAIATDAVDICICLISNRSCKAGRGSNTASAAQECDDSHTRKARCLSVIHTRVMPRLPPSAAIDALVSVALLLLQKHRQLLAPVL